MPDQSKTPIRRIAIDEVRRRRKELVFVDARSTTALAKNPFRVPGAVYVPAKQLDEALKKLPRNRTLVTYCT